MFEQTFKNLADIQEKDRYDVVLANPPFGGKERAEVQQNFPIKTGETASLFLQHFIKILKAGGKAGVVIKNTFLSNTDNASVSLRKSHYAHEIQLLAILTISMSDKTIPAEANICLCRKSKSSSNMAQYFIQRVRLIWLFILKIKK